MIYSEMKLQDEYSEDAGERPGNWKKVCQNM